jgi:hypothetical protein
MPARIRSIWELKRELKARTGQLARLQARRKRAAARLTRIERQIVALGGEVGMARVGRGRRRRRRGRPRLPGRPVGRPRKRRARATGKPLIEYVRAVLAKAPQGMRAKDVASAVTKAGYRSFSKDFYGIVATTLRDKRFKRLHRGVYTLAG